MTAYLAAVNVVAAAAALLLLPLLSTAVLVSCIPQPAPNRLHLCLAPAN
jgi:hypothetical protein